MPFGVELPENLGAELPQTATPDAAPKETPADANPAPQKDLQEASRPEANRDITDLDKLERLPFEVRDWDPKSLKNAMLAHADYTRKTQEIAEARKYADNFSADLGHVMDDPSLLAKMRQIYPAEYVQHAEAILSRLGKTGNPGNQSQPAPSDNSQTENPLAREVQELKAWKQQWEQEQTEARV